MGYPDLRWPELSKSRWTHLVAKEALGYGTDVTES